MIRQSRSDPQGDTLSQALRQTGHRFRDDAICRSTSAAGLRSEWRVTEIGQTYPLSHLYGYFGLVRLSRLGHDVAWVKARSLVREPDAGCVRRSWYELASASLARPKPSKQDGSEPCGRRGNAASEAWVAVGWGVGLTPEIGLLRRPSSRSHHRRQHIGSRQARGPVLRRGLRPGSEWRIPEPKRPISSHRDRKLWMPTPFVTPCG